MDETDRVCRRRLSKQFPSSRPETGVYSSFPSKLRTVARVMCIKRAKVKSTSKREAESSLKTGPANAQPQLLLATKSSTKELASTKDSGVIEKASQDKADSSKPSTKEKKSERKMKSLRLGGDRDKSQEKMSPENTLKEVPNKMPDVDLNVDPAAKEPMFTNDQLL
ncbi:hypothetical protein L596_015935 [Steinernema carpocapsae]|uniref:Uncharacterized protein n=1 Tax=Steinernema carpocapsae TaxID=34508 RepID=A0A4U5NHF5_STECR|nr:hypothetical protein L596_015935 [Steinernema carpocapsae]